MTTMTQWLFNRIDSHRNRSRLQRLSRVFPMNVSQDGPLFPEAGRSYLESTLRTTSLSICTPKTLEIKSAIRNTWTAIPWVPPFCFDNSTDELFGGALRPWLFLSAGCKQQPVFGLHENFMQAQERRWFYDHRVLGKSARMD